MNKTIGCILIATGSAIGGGMIALPIAVSGMGFSIAVILLVATAAISYMTSLVLLEVNLAFRAPNNSYSSMAEAFFGSAGKSIICFLFGVFLYAMISAYISGGASLIQAAVQLIFKTSIPQWINTVLYTLVLGGAVIFSTRAVDLMNRAFFSLKMFLIAMIFIALLPQVNIVQLMAQHEWIYAGAGIPIIVTAFGAHIVLPSITEYIGRDVAKLKLILLCANIVPLCVYLIWVASLIGTIPHAGENSFSSIASSPSQVETLMLVMTQNLQSPIMTFVINLFSHIVIVTSFLGCSLCMFDFIRDNKIGSVAHNRLFVSIVTFFPPLIVGFMFQDALVQLLAYASILYAVILIIIPAVMAWRMRQMNCFISPYCAPGGNILLIVVGLAGCAMIVAEILRIVGIFSLWNG